MRLTWFQRARLKVRSRALTRQLDQLAVEIQAAQALERAVTRELAYVGLALYKDAHAREVTNEHTYLGG